MGTIFTIIIILIIISFYKNYKKENNNIETTEIISNNINTKKNINYALQENIFTNNERFFYKILKEITYSMDLIIMTKVRLADIIYCKNNNYSDFNKIKAKHIDFVLIDNNGKIRLLIELDDKSHENYERKQRDKFLNEIFENLKINLLRIPTKNIYNIEELKAKIEESL
ncbi:MAG: DUF2726 domain-containing protein [Clostridia bacterium]|nr:DUF2726 domain-containing protein [Clostridia bacterium]